MGSRMTPPAACNRLAHYRLGEPGHRTSARCEHDPVLLHEGLCLIDSHDAAQAMRLVIAIFRDACRRTGRSLRTLPWSPARLDRGNTARAIDLRRPAAPLRPRRGAACDGRAPCWRGADRASRW